jgi:hypothetical protein
MLYRCEISPGISGLCSFLSANESAGYNFNIFSASLWVIYIYRKDFHNPSAGIKMSKNTTDERVPGWLK